MSEKKGYFLKENEDSITLDSTYDFLVVGCGIFIFVNFIYCFLISFWTLISMID